MSQLQISQQPDRAYEFVGPLHYCCCEWRMEPPETPQTSTPSKEPDGKGPLTRAARDIRPDSTVDVAFLKVLSRVCSAFRSHNTLQSRRRRSNLGTAQSKGAVKSDLLARTLSPGAANVDPELSSRRSTSRSASLRFWGICGNSSNANKWYACLLSLGWLCLVPVFRFACGVLCTLSLASQHEARQCTQLPLLDIQIMRAVCLHQGRLLSFARRKDPRPS